MHWSGALQRTHTARDDTDIHRYRTSQQFLMFPVVKDRNSSTGILVQWVPGIVVDRYRFDVDPDPTFYFDADPDPDSDPDPTSSLYKLQIQKFVLPFYSQHLQFTLFCLSH